MPDERRGRSVSRNRMARDYHGEPHPTWDDLYRSLGKLLTASSRVEEAAMTLVLEMMGAKTGVRIRATLLIDDLPHAAIVDRIERLASRVLAGDLQADVYQWAVDARTWRTHRNELVHGGWADRIMQSDGEIGPGTISTNVKKARKGLRSRATEWTPEAVEAVAIEGYRISHRGGQLMMELRKHSHAEARQGGTARWARPGDSRPD